MEDDIVYCTLPLYHTNGGVLASGQMLFWGSTLALRRKFSASNFWSDCVKHQCTVRSNASLAITFIRIMTVYSFLIIY